ncbi:DUF58 domain-containing protein [Entomobacter blattae]|uniref:DUF58 domain-containing protein n=1 Tax=Entomobacter blattae TaxID=2762277 RepID=A0A7H1NNC7_9PROT|nr:DUF58 domain-containing protein [Entomobacter blattae]QNT77287.1 hypothetical protein JGUZn3_00200 [Entomobacter blattae]
MNASSSFSLQQAYDLAAKFPAIRLSAYQAAQTLLWGQHGRKRKGEGEEFWQFRKLFPGESLSRVDWRQSARSQNIFIRETERLTVQTLCLWVDFSSSMAWGSEGSPFTKLHYALTQALALAYCALDNQERLLVINPYTGEQIFFNSTARFPALCDFFFHLLSHSQETPPSPLPKSEFLPPHCHLALFSDGLFTLSSIAPLLKTLALQSTRTFFFQVNDPQEAQFSYEGRILFEGTENEPSHLVPNALSVAQNYQNNFKHHSVQLAELCQNNHIHYWSFLTSQPLMQPLQHIFRLVDSSLEKRNL